LTDLVKSDLVGTWSLTSFSLTEDGTGKTVFPYGTEVNGMLFITADDHFAVFISSARRAAFSSNDIMSGSEKEKINAAESFSSYCGDFDLKQDSLIFHPKVSFFPNWVGVDQQRFLTRREDGLIELSSRTLVNGMLRISHSVWRRTDQTPE